MLGCLEYGGQSCEDQEGRKQNFTGACSQIAFERQKLCLNFSYAYQHYLENDQSDTGRLEIIKQKISENFQSSLGQTKRQGHHFSNSTTNQEFKTDLIPNFLANNDIQ